MLNILFPAFFDSEIFILQQQILYKMLVKSKIISPSSISLDSESLPELIK